MAELFLVGLQFMHLRGMRKDTRRVSVEIDIIPKTNVDLFWTHLFIPLCSSVLEWMTCILVLQYVYQNLSL